MKYNELSISKQKKPTRVGRGISAGKGKTAGRGTKGQGARKSPVKAGFEGGQMPLYMRLPKLRGFKSKRVRPETVTTSQINSLKSASIDNKVLAEAGLVSNEFVSVKVIVGGEITANKNVKLQGASAGALKTIEKAGGTFTVTTRQARESKKSKEA